MNIYIWGIRRSGNSPVRNWIANQFPDCHNLINASAEAISKGVKKGKGWQKKNHVVSFEDHSLGTLDLVGGKKVVILRDPYNLFASRIKHYDLFSSSGKWVNRRMATNLWMQYAKFFIRKPKDVILINYNKFIKSEVFRKSVSEKLGGKFNDDSIRFVDDNGGGSSFNGTSFSGNAQEMPVFDRWKEYKDNKVFKALFTKDIRELSKRIFGFAPF